MGHREVPSIVSLQISGVKESMVNGPKVEWALNVQQMTF
jgi:hypothetical protein